MVQLSQVVDRLTQLGYAPTDSDTKQVQFELDLILDYVVNYCNFPDRNDIPGVLDKRIIDRVCSEYLMKKKNAGQLAGFDYEVVVKSIKEGDVQYQFGTQNDGATPESRFNSMVNDMQRGFDKWISLYRRIRW